MSNFPAAAKPLEAIEEAQFYDESQSSQKGKNPQFYAQPSFISSLAFFQDNDRDFYDAISFDGISCLSLPYSSIYTLRYARKAQRELESYCPSCSSRSPTFK